ncbi:MAG: anaerobic ribonucleoside-triphosphate reductase activating protein [Oscillospiraceae bacterium]|nr:anaerobic ribonucleoside-triphosphate reductase activating protein [Oscillospiraceae bacterium]
MQIHGLQKMTLLDFPGRVACTVFLGGCDYRCPFCHNYELIDGTAQPVMDDKALLSFLEKRRGLLDGVAITGGEPCLHADLPALLEKIRALGYAVKLDTNGTHPDLLEELLERRLVDYVAMDVKNSPEKYALTCGVAQVDLDAIYRSIALLTNRAPDYEFRTTVVKELHEISDFTAIGKLIAGARRYFLQCFTDRDSVPFGDLHAPSGEDLRRFAGAARPFVPDTQIRGVDL